MQVVNKPLIDLNKAAIKSGDVELTVAVVLVNCALAPTGNGQQRSPKDIADRYELAIRLNSLKVDESFDITPELMVSLKDDLCRVYATIVAGQMLPIMDGTVTH